MDEPGSVLGAGAGLGGGVVSVRYAVVPVRGCYGPGSRVRPMRVTGSLDRALVLARQATAAYRRGVPGYTSSGYRVIATTARDRRQVEWLGWQLDLETGIEVQS